MPARPASLRVWALPAALLTLLTLLYTGPLPLAADFLCRLSPGWRMNPVEFKNKPPKPPPSGKEGSPADPAGSSPPATSMGIEESAATASHRLPPRSNLQPSDVPRLFVRISDPAQAAGLLKDGPVYIRSHTLNRFAKDQWTPDVTGGAWVEDAEDGTTDGVVTLSPRSASPGIRHEVFLLQTQGYSLPAIAGLTSLRLPRVFAVPGELHQADLSGDIRYEAESVPLFYHRLPNPGLLEAAPQTDKSHLNLPDGELGLQLSRLADTLFRQAPLLSDRIAALRTFFASHYQYSTEMRNPSSLGPLENFLFDERRGHCGFYASAAALLLREAGIPTRTAYGYAGAEMNGENHTLTFRERNAHAWTEIEIRGHGWVICDFSPAEHIGQPSLTPSPTPPAPALEPSAFKDAAEIKPPPAPVRSRQELPFFSSLMDWFKKQPWTSSLLQYGPYSLLAFAVLLALRQWWKNRPRDAAARAAEARAELDRQPEYFREFLRLSEAAGHPKPDGRTPLDHYQSLVLAGLPVPPLRPLISYHCATRYEDEPRNQETEQSFTSPLQEFALAIAPAPAAGESPLRRKN